LGWYHNTWFRLNERNLLPGTVIGIPLHAVDGGSGWSPMTELMFSETDGAVKFQHVECMRGGPGFRGSVAELGAAAQQCTVDAEGGLKRRELLQKVNLPIFTHAARCDYPGPLTACSATEDCAVDGIRCYSGFCIDTRQ
jgi:hypothetical protein